MPTLTNDASSMTGDIMLTKQTGTVLRLASTGKYVDRDIEFTIEAQSAATAANTAVADADIDSSDDSSGGINISDVIGAKQGEEPDSGYYIRILASGAGGSRVTSPGWVDAGDLAPASATSTKFFPVSAGTASVTGESTITPSASIDGSGITLSDVDNGIRIIATGGGSAVSTVEATTDSAGYVPANKRLDSIIIHAESKTKMTSAYLSGVVLAPPESGTRLFSVTVPNGASTQMITFTVDADGNVTID